MGIKRILAAGLLIASWLPLSVGAQVVLEAEDGPQSFRFQRLGRRILPDSLAWQPDSGVVLGWNALGLVPQDTISIDLQPATWQPWSAPSGTVVRWQDAGRIEWVLSDSLGYRTLRQQNPGRLWQFSTPLAHARFPFTVGDTLAIAAKALCEKDTLLPIQGIDSLRILRTWQGYNHVPSSGNISLAEGTWASLCLRQWSVITDSLFFKTNGVWSTTAEVSVDTAETLRWMANGREGELAKAVIQDSVQVLEWRLSASTASAVPKTTASNPFAPYPNPTSGAFNLNLGPGNFSLAVNDALGRNVFNVLDANGQQTIMLPQAGYFVLWLTDLKTGHFWRTTLIKTPND